MGSMAWINAPAEHDADQALRVAVAVAESRHLATEADHLSQEVADALTAFRMQLHLVDTLRPRTG